MTTAGRVVSCVGALAILVAACVPAWAAAAPEAKCKSAKARAATKKAAALAKAFAKNEGSPNAVKLLADVSKAQSKLTRAFTKAEAKGPCASVGDAGTIEAKVDAFVTDLLEELPSAPTTTSTTTTPGTTTTTMQVACGLSAFPACGGMCGTGEICVPVRAESSCSAPATDSCFCVPVAATCAGTGSCLQNDCEVGVCPLGEVCRAFDGCCSDFCGSECVVP